MTIVRRQPQNAQLELVFNAPLIKDSQVETVSDLLTLRYNYVNRLAFVNDESMYYVLKSGDGSQAEHWQRISQKITILPFDASIAYSTSELVYVGSSIYVATVDSVDSYPPLNLDKWIQLSGTNITTRTIFENLSEVTIYTEVTNPTFQIISGTPRKNDDDEYVLGDDNLIVIDGAKFIDAYIEKLDIPNNNGRPYKISFFAEGEPTQLSGAINIK